MAYRIVILGGGLGGTITANRLRAQMGDSAQVTVIDQDDRHIYQPGLLFVPFGMADPDEIVRPRARQLHDGIEFVTGTIDRVDLATRKVHVAGGRSFDYDVLVVATGAQVQPEETEGLTGTGWNESMFTFYTLEGAIGLRDALERFDSGRLVVNVVDMPIKCPVAPLEFCFLADWYLQKRGVRDNVELTYVTPLDDAFTKPVAAEHLAGLLEQKGINLVTEFATGQADGERGRLISWDDRVVEFDLLATIPAHGGAACVGRSEGLGDALGFIPCNLNTLQSKVQPNVFVIGDATDLPASKAGSVTHFESELLVSNIESFLNDRPLDDSFDGHSNCFVETGFHKALLIDFNYDVEPLPGKFPLPHLGPLPLLKESRMNHLAKLAFQGIYWHMLLPGHDMPGISATMRPPSRRALAATSTPEGDA